MDQSVILLSDDEGEGETGFGKQPSSSIGSQHDIDRKIRKYSRDEEEREPKQSCSKFLDDDDVDIDNRSLLDLNDAAFLNLTSSSDNESSQSKEKPRYELDEIPECEDFSNWYSHESFSQPVQSSSIFQEIQPGTEKIVLVPNSADRRASSICIARSVSDDICMNKRRRKRTKEEINAEQAAKKEARERKNQERIEKKKRIDLAKQLAKFEREVSATKKTKCEQNLFCIINLDLIASVDNLDKLIRNVFTDRDIHDQFIFDGTGMTVCWKRKSLQGGVENDEFIRKEKLIYEKFCILSMKAQRYDQFKSPDEIAGFIGDCLKNYPFSSPQLTLVVYGLLKSRKEKVADFVLEIFERFRVQTRFIVTAEEYAMLIAQMHRAIARHESRLEKQILPIVNIEKGITEGDNSTIVSDWWMKMLSQIHRMGTDAQRTIANTFPNPHALSKLLKSVTMKEGMKLLADTKMESGKRIGPMLAHKIYLMLTSVNGTEIIDES